jgi:hypothetical protein
MRPLRPSGGVYITDGASRRTAPGPARPARPRDPGPAARQHQAAPGLPPRTPRLREPQRARNQGALIQEPKLMARYSRQAASVLLTFRYAMLTLSCVSGDIVAALNTALHGQALRDLVLDRSRPFGRCSKPIRCVRARLARACRRLLSGREITQE